MPIDSTFVPKESRWQDMYSLLKSKGFDVYAPAQKIGECVSPYVVVKNDGSYGHVQYSTERDLYTVYCYVPRDKYSLLEPLVQQVKIAMRDLYPMFRPYHQQLPSFYDEETKAHGIGIEYENFKKVIFM